MNAPRIGGQLQAIVIISLTGIYLLFEWAFNAALLDVIPQDVDAIRALELEGRTLAGIGFALLAYRFVPKDWKTSFNGYARILVLLISVFVVTFFGQRLLVDSFVAGANQQQRDEARTLIVFKQGLKAGVVGIDGLTVDGSESIEQRSFQTLIGLMIFAHPDYAKTVTVNIDAIIERLGDKEALRQHPGQWAAYQENNLALHQAYDKYNDQVKGLFVKAGGLRIQLKEFFKAKKRCKQGTAKYAKICNKRVQASYDQEISKLLPKNPVHWSHWCEKVRGKTKFARVGSSVKKVKLPDTLNCNLSIAALENRILAALGDPEKAESFSDFAQKNAPKLIPDLDEGAFYKTVLTPEVQIHFKEVAQKLAATAESEVEEDALRVLLVPPVSMAFSLVGGLLNTISFLVLVTVLLAPVMGRFKAFLSILGAVSVIGLPMLLPSPVADSRSFISLVERVDYVGGFIDWTMRAQPKLYAVSSTAKQLIRE